MATLGRLAHALIAILLAVLLVPSAYAAENLRLIEQEIKAGLLYNFLKYTEWPERSSQAGASLDVCLLGGDPFNGRLDAMANRTVNQRMIKVQTIRNVAAAQTCSLLVIDAGQKASWPDMQKALNGKGVLTVSDFEGFAMSGGMIEFTRINDRIGVKINTDAVMAAHLEVQDRLLRLASAVGSTPQAK